MAEPAAPPGVPPAVTDEIGGTLEATAGVIGRDRELRDLDTRVIAATGPITVTGPPGIGKTRLALAYVDQLRDQHRAATFCDLRFAEHQRDIGLALTRELGLERAEGAHGEDSLVEALRSRGPCVYVLDNVEQLIDVGGGEVLGRLCRAAPLARFVVTTRSILRVFGESIVELGPLSLDGEGGQPSDAAVLFCNRATAFEPSLCGLKPEDSRVVEVVRRLEGIPLAIELAVGQLRVLSIDGLVRALRAGHPHFELNVSGIDERHRTLRAAVGSSWRLLTPWQQDALRQLTAFRGGFGLSAAEAVVDLSDYREVPPLREILAFLRDSSWLRVGAEADYSGQRRWDMFEALRDAVEEERPNRGGEDAYRAQDHHALFFAARLAEWVDALTTARSAEAQAGLTAELPNLRVAYDHVIQQARQAATEGDHAADHANTTVVLMATRLHRVLVAWSPESAHDVVEKALPFAKAPEARAELWAARGEAARVMGDYVAAERGLEQARASEHSPSLDIELHHQSGMLELFRGRWMQARAHLEQARKLARELGSPLEGRSSWCLAWVLAEGFGDATAFELYQEATAQLAETGNVKEWTRASVAWCAHQVFFRVSDPTHELERHFVTAGVLKDRYIETAVAVALGISHQDRGRRSEARRWYLCASQLAHETGVRRSQATVDMWLGTLTEEEGRADDASALYARAAEVFASIDDARGEAVCLVHQAGALARRGDLTRAQTTIERAEALAKISHSPVTQQQVDLQRAALGLCRGVGSDEAMRHRTRVVDELERSFASRTPADSKRARTIGERSPEARVITRLLIRSLGVGSGGDRTIRFSSQWRTIRINDDREVDLEHRPVMRRMMKTLATERLRRPGQPVSTTELIDRGWPDELMSPESGATRVLRTNDDRVVHLPQQTFRPFAPCHD